MENDNIKYYGLCFEWILSRKDIMTDPEKKKRYKYQRNKIFPLKQFTHF